MSKTIMMIRLNWLMQKGSSIAQRVPVRCKEDTSR